MVVKWAGVLVAALSIALDAMANLLLVTIGRAPVPMWINLFAVGLAAVAAVSAYVTHLFGRLDAKLDLVMELLVGRFDELETRIGDRNSGFVEGYMLSRTPEAPVVPLVPRGTGRRAPAHE